MNKQWNEILRALTIKVKNILSKDTDNAFATKTWDNHSWVTSKVNNKIPSLIKTGNMKNSIKWSSKNTTVQATAKNYAKFQNEGTKYIPARPFIGLSDVSKEIINKELNKLIYHKMNNVLRDMFRTIK